MVRTASGVIHSKVTPFAADYLPSNTAAYKFTSFITVSVVYVDVYCCPPSGQK
jgi:hypothetical protein